MKATSWKDLDWRIVGVMLVGAACLALQGAIARGQMPGPIGAWLASIRLPHTRMGIVIAYGVVPFLCLRILGWNPLRYFRIGRFREVFPWFALFLLIVVGSTVWLATFGSFQSAYGRAGQLAFYPLLGTFVTMICGEFFFRGFLLFPLFEKFGWYALPIGIMPYALIHLGDPIGVLYGSIVFGLGLAYLAVRSGSIWYAVIIHWALNVALPLSITLLK